MMTRNLCLQISIISLVNNKLKKGHYSINISTFSLCRWSGEWWAPWVQLRQSVECRMDNTAIRCGVSHLTFHLFLSSFDHVFVFPCILAYSLGHRSDSRTVSINALLSPWEGGARLVANISILLFVNTQLLSIKFAVI